MANSLGLPVAGGRPLTVQDLDGLSDDGYRYEIFDGSLLVTPPPALPHALTISELRLRLDRHLSGDLRTAENVGVRPDETNFYIPDLIVVRRQTLRRGGQWAAPADVLLAVEVVSPNNPGNDHVLKRHAYAVAGIREFWIVDERDQTLRVLMPGDDGGYAERAVVRPGERWRSTEPFPLEVDPGELF